MIRCRRIIALAALALAGCEAEVTGAGVYFHTRPLTEAQADSFERALAAAPFRIHTVRGKRIPGAPERGEVQLIRGADSPAELDRLTTWLRQQPSIVAAGRDSAAVFR
jgi:hypothetical protein